MSTAIEQNGQAVGIGGLLKWWAWDDVGHRKAVWARDRAEAKRVTIRDHKFVPLCIEPASSLVKEMAMGWNPPSRHEADKEGVDDAR